ncbi:hypothetical protein DFH28DRAFT_1086128 [Melampsora americana]|nr:hypothetical protein DFH28DRAFT_1086128 [Melampsora americana]
MNPSNLTIQVIDRESLTPIQSLAPSIHTPPVYTLSSPLKKSPNERKTLRVRRPFKYLKHQGPRPIPTNSNNRLYHSNQIISTNEPYHQPISKSKPNSRIRTTSSLRSPKKSSSSLHEPKSLSNRSNENKPYSQSSSRLLKSRNLNLTAIDISACKLSKKPGVELLHDEPGSVTKSGRSIHPSLSPHRPSQHLSSSCFSAWSTTTSSTQLKSYSFLSSNSTHSENHSETHLTDHLEKCNLFHSTHRHDHQTKLPLQKRSISYHESNPTHWFSSDPHLFNTSDSILP